MINNMKLIFTIIFMLLVSESLHSKNLALFKISPKLPTYERLEGYREKFTCISDEDFFSGMHWNHKIKIYIKGDTKAYVINHIQYLLRYLSDDLDEDLEETVYDVIGEKFSYTPGTIIIKENYLEKEELLTPLFLTVMIKHKAGYAPDSGDWEYLKISKDGFLILGGKATNEAVKKDCFECHANLKSQDFTFASSFGRVNASNHLEKLIKSLHRVKN